MSNTTNKKVEGIDFVYCQYCINDPNNGISEEYDNINPNHLKFKHNGKSVQNHKDDYPNYPISSKKYLDKKKVIGKNTYVKMDSYDLKYTMPQCIEYYDRFDFLNTEEKQKMLDIYKEARYKDAKNKENLPFCIEFYIKRNPTGTHEDHLNSLNNFIVRVNELNSKRPYNTQLKFYTLVKNMSEEDAKKALKKRQNTKNRPSNLD